MKIAILTFFLSLSIVLNAQESQINFRDFNSFKEIKAAAKKESKDIMLYFHYKGCGWCRHMEKTTFIDSTVGEYYNQTFINVSLDFLKDSIGINMENKGMVPGAPSYVFMDAKGVVKHNEVGYKVVEDFLMVGQLASDPTANFSFYAQKLANHDYSVETIFQIISKGPRRADRDSLINLMIESNKNKPEELYGEKSFHLIFERGFVGRSPVKEFISDNYESFVKYTGRDIVENTFKSFWAWKINNGWFLFWNLDSKREKNKIYYADKEIINYDKICAYADYSNALDYYTRVKRKRKKWFIKYVNTADKYFAIYHNDWRTYSEAALEILATKYRFKDQEYIDRAKTWAEMAVKIKECPQSLYTYAFMLKELNKTDEAIKTLNKVIKLSRKNISYENYYYRDMATKFIKYWQDS